MADSPPDAEPELLAEQLKRFNDTDLNALCEATDAAIIDGGGFGWVNPPGRRALETYFRGVLLVPERELFVARLNGDIVGSAILVRPPRNNEAQAFAASLMHSYIAPYARGYGLARKLTGTVEERARELGYHILNLDVRQTQTVAIRMYRIARLCPLGRASRVCPGRRQAGYRVVLLQAAPPGEIGHGPMPGLTLYPAIDLKDGQCVRLRRGEMDQATVYADDPGIQAKAWQAAGFSWLHVVDLNGAFAGKPVNAAAVRSILSNVTIPVQLGGGIRDLPGIAAWLDCRHPSRDPGQRRRQEPGLGDRSLQGISRADCRRYRCPGRIRCHGRLGQDLRHGGHRPRAALRGSRCLGDHLY